MQKAAQNNERDLIAVMPLRSLRIHAKRSDALVTVAQPVLLPFMPFTPPAEPLNTSLSTK